MEFERASELSVFLKVQEKSVHIKMKWLYPNPISYCKKERMRRVTSLKTMKAHQKDVLKKKKKEKKKPITCYFIMS